MTWSGGLRQARSPSQMSLTMWRALELGEPAQEATARLVARVLDLEQHGSATWMIAGRSADTRVGYRDPLSAGLPGPGAWGGAQ